MATRQGTLLLLCPFHQWRARCNHRGGSRGAPDELGKLTRNPSPQVCNLDRIVPQHTSLAVHEAPDPPVYTVRISTALTLHSEVSFLVLIQIPGLPDPVSALIDSAATSNFLDSSLADSPLFVMETLDRPITLFLF